MIDWVEVAGSNAVSAEAYDAETETIYVRFKNGVAWAYHSCPPHIWGEFTAPGQSRGQYVHRVLKYKPGEKIAD